MAKGILPQGPGVRASPGPRYTGRATHCEGRSCITWQFRRFPVGQVDHQSAFSPVAPLRKEAILGLRLVRLLSFTVKQLRAS